MDRTIIKMWLKERRVTKALPEKQLRHLCQDNSSGHSFDQKILDAAKALPIIVHYVSAMQPI